MPHQKRGLQPTPPAMPDVAEICRWLESLAPLALAEEWDNVGLLVGDSARPVRRVMTCLTITPRSTAEAIARQADLVVTHHPLPFRPLKRLTSDSTVGRLLLELIEARVAIYSAHTAYDSAADGMNGQLAAALGLQDVAPLAMKDETLGAGRYGKLPAAESLAVFCERVKRSFALARVQCVGSRDRSVQRVAVACGSAGEFLARTVELGCDAFITGETNFHTCLEAEAQDVGLVLVGHYASERRGLERLAEQLGAQFAEVEVWASRDEADPLRWV